MAQIQILAAAVADLVHDGDTVALEGFTRLIPFAAGHEVIRQGRTDLTLVRMTPDLLYDQMVGMGCARMLVFSYGGNPGVGSLHRFRDAIENGWPLPLKIEEHSHAGMANRYAASASGLPFAVMRGYVGTDRAGNVQLWGIPGVQKEAVLGARRSLVTVERIVDELEPRPGVVVIPGWAIDAVAEAPGGSLPSYSLGITERDNDFYRFWDKLSRDRDEFRTWMDENVTNGAAV